MIHIAIEGNIAAGKSTFVHKLLNHIRTKGINKQFEVFPEPLDDWTNYKAKGVGYNLLELQYEKPDKFALAFQIAAATTKCDQLLAGGENMIVERTLACQRLVFIPILRAKNLIDDLHTDLLSNTVKKLEMIPKMTPDKILYLRCEPEIAQSRAVSRARPEERSAVADTELFRAIHEKYEEWLNPGNSLIIDCNNPDVDMGDIYDKLETYLVK